MEQGLTLQDQQPAKQHELSQVGAAAKEQHEIQSAIIIAKKMPRNEEACFQKLMKAASRPSFAEDATYSFPRGTKEDGTKNMVSGPSVNLAREAARVWGNIRYGLYVVRDDHDSRLIRGWAWDVETNTKVEVEDDFKKLIQRKKQGGKPGETVWIEPDERDLRELTNRRGAILLRNAILQVLPKDLIEDALFACEEALKKAAGENPEGARKRLLVDFGSINITVEHLEQKLGHPFAQSTPKEIAELRGICKSIMDGNTTWAEYIKEPEAKPAEDVNKAKLAAAQEALKQQREQPKAEPKKEEAKPAQPNLPPDVQSTSPAAAPPAEGYDAGWLSRVLDCEDFLRGTPQGKGSLRSIRTGFKLADGAYPMLPDDQRDYLSDLERTVERMQAQAKA